MAKSAGIALISVYDKTGIVDFVEQLIEFGWQIYASGGTAAKLSQAGLKIKNVSALVGGNAILGHRVVTLSREISAGLLADKSNPNDIKEMQALNLPIIDLVCVDMYPLEAAINQPGSSRSKVIEQTDIGGPTLLRSAAKGNRIVLSVASQRSQVIDWLKNGKPNEANFKRNLAARAEYECARYIMASASYHNGTDISGNLALKVTSTKYGENPQQAEAGFYSDNRFNTDKLSIDKFNHVKGSEQSFINITDIDRLLQTVTHIAAAYDLNYKSVPAIAVGVKHGNACGAGIGDDILTALKKMLNGDLRAIFGGVIMINRPIDDEVATLLMTYKMLAGKTRLLDGVVGSSVTKSALDILTRNRLRLVVNPALNNLGKDSLNKAKLVRPVRGGLLEQPNYSFVLNLSHPDIRTYGDFSDRQRRDILFAWAVGSTSNSNTITLVKAGQLIGNGVGQQDRVGAAQLALSRTTTEVPKLMEKNDTIDMTVSLDKAKLNGSVAYSDSFFPFPDGPGLLARAGIRAIMSTSGSIGDESVIASLTKAHVSLMMIPDKIGRGFYAH
ncbi:MAG: bifunctional phosphoribosylaminoimidazolecarboxamide formyltransferase/IMP cyclohydrolase [Candidatus Saccharimonadales bacterium]